MKDFKEKTMNKRLKRKRHYGLELDDGFIKLIDKEIVRNRKQLKNKDLYKELTELDNEFSKNISKYFNEKDDEFLYSPHNLIDLLYDIVKKREINDEIRKIYSSMMIGFQFLFRETRDKYAPDGEYSFSTKKLCESEKKRNDLKNYSQFVDFALGMGVSSEKDFYSFSIKYVLGIGGKKTSITEQNEKVKECYKSLCEIMGENIHEIVSRFRSVINRFNKNESYVKILKEKIYIEKIKLLYKDLLNEYCKDDPIDYYLFKDENGKFCVNNEEKNYKIDEISIYDVKSVYDMLALISKTFISNMKQNVCVLSGFNTYYSKEQADLILPKSIRINMDRDIRSKMRGEKNLQDVISSKLDEYILIDRKDKFDGKKPNKKKTEMIKKIKSIMESYYKGICNEQEEDDISIDEDLVHDFLEFILDDEYFSIEYNKVFKDGNDIKIRLAPIIAYGMITLGTGIKKWNKNHEWKKHEIIGDMNFTKDKKNICKKVGLYIRLRNLFANKNNVEEMKNIWDNIFSMLTGYNDAYMICTDANINDYGKDMFAVEYICDNWNEDLNVSIVSVARKNDLEFNKLYENIKCMYKKRRREPIYKFFEPDIEECFDDYRKNRYFVWDKNEHRLFLQKFIDKTYNKKREKERNKDCKDNYNTDDYIKFLKKYESECRNKSKVYIRDMDIAKLVIEEYLKNKNIEESKKKLKEISEILKNKL